MSKTLTALIGSVGANTSCIATLSGQNGVCADVETVPADAQLELIDL